MRTVSHKAVHNAIPAPQGVITLTEVLRIMAGNEPFSIGFTTANRQTGEGGELRYYPVAHSCRLEAMPANLLKRNGIKLYDRRAANHADHKTRNIFIGATGEIKKVHFKLINQFNGKKVLL